MSLIQVTPEILKSQATTVRKYKTDQEQTMKRIRNLVLSLNDSWKGEAQDAFVAKFQSMDQTYRKLSQVLESYAKLMDTAANELQATDQNLRSIIRNIG
jgi:WXG100 family type VII secretion target